MKYTLAILFLITTSSFAGPNDPIDVDVEVNHYGTKYCQCALPEFLNKICITSTRWSMTDPMLNEKGTLTDFDAVINNDIFTMTSTAHYVKCEYGETPNVFTDPQWQDKFKGKKFYNMVAVKGNKAWFKVYSIDPATKKRTLLQASSGNFKDEKAFFNKGEENEFYLMQYPGTALFQRPLDQVISDFRIRQILEGDEYVKTLAAILMIETKDQGTVAFGEYILRLRFFLKPGVTPVNAWDTSAIKAEITQL